MKKRDVGLDGLRTIGLLAIILAHVGPPGWLFQLRNFDVPLMILVSGAVFNLSSGKDKSYLDYFKSRVGRLLIPTWVFLAIFFPLTLLITKMLHEVYPYSQKVILESFELTSGTGYVWIIRVFILVAIALPFLIKIYEKLSDKRLYLPILLIAFILYEYFLLSYKSSGFFIQYLVLYIVPYGIISGLGFYITKVSNKVVAILSFLSFVGFLALMNFYSNPFFVPTQNFKYPPQAYYFSYALAVSLSLYIISKTQIFQKIFSNKILLFISSSSLWIFLWQILYLFIWSEFKIHNFVLEYIFVLLFSTLTTYLHKKILQRYSKNDFIKTAFLR